MSLRQRITIPKKFKIYTKKVGKDVKKYLEGDGLNFRYDGNNFDDGEWCYRWRCVKSNQP